MTGTKEAVWSLALRSARPDVLYSRSLDGGATAGWRGRRGRIRGVWGGCWCVVVGGGGVCCRLVSSPGVRGACRLPLAAWPKCARANLQSSQRLGCSATSPPNPTSGKTQNQHRIRGFRSIAPLLMMLIRQMELLSRREGGARDLMRDSPPSWQGDFETTASASRRLQLQKSKSTPHHNTNSSNSTLSDTRPR